MNEYKYMRPKSGVDTDWAALQKMNQEELVHTLGLDKEPLYKPYEPD